jgi:hypothetical protein
MTLRCGRYRRNTDNEPVVFGDAGRIQLMPRGLLGAARGSAPPHAAARRAIPGLIAASALRRAQEPRRMSGLRASRRWIQWLRWTMRLVKEVARKASPSTGPSR